MPLMQNWSRSSDVLKIDLEDFDADVTTAHVVFSPNPKWIELKTNVDQYWSKEIILSNVPLRRLDLQKSNPKSQIQQE